MKTYMIILASGIGSRLSESLLKQLSKIAGRDSNDTPSL